VAKEKAAVAAEPDPDEPALVPGRWYMFMGAARGFTYFGVYVRPLGGDKHRFRHVCHLRHAGNMTLAEICRNGPGPQTKYTPEFPGFAGLFVHTWHDYTGPPLNPKGQL
jgi:hypothetical protein